MFLLLLLFQHLLLSVSAPSPSAPAFRFAIVSDTHIGGAPTASEDLRRTVADINADSDLAFAVFSGDITELGSDVELAEAHQILAQLNKPWYVIPGNHDTKWSESGNNSFRQVFGYERFYFEHGGFVFLGCNSGPNMRMAPGLVPAEDLLWLDSIVSQLPAGQPLVFFNHYPMDEGLGNWYKVIDILKKANTQVAFCGHGHANKVLSAEGIPAAMCRSNLRAKADTGAYNIVSVYPDSLTLSVRQPGSRSAAPWHRIGLGKRDFSADTATYPRPDFSVNDQYPQVKVAWQIQDPCDIGAGIAISGDVAVYANTCGSVKAVFWKNGTPKWEFSALGKIYSTPAIEQGRVVLASADSVIYCLSVRSGELLWRFKTGKAIVASPVIADGVVYIGSSEGKFRALSLQSGALLWEFNGVEGFVETRPALDEERLYFGSWGTYFYALNRKDGALAWKWNNGSSNRMLSPAAVFPVVSDGMVFIVAPDRFATALDARTGRAVWRTDKKVGRESIGISADQQTIYVKSMTDTITAFSATGHTLQQKWQAHAGFGYDIAPSPMTERAGRLFIPTDKGALIALNPETQKVEWTHKLCNALINNAVPLSDGRVLGATMDGLVFLLQEK